MAADPEPQTLEEGSVWPGWAGSLLLDVRLDRLSRKTGHTFSSRHSRKPLSAVEVHLESLYGCARHPNSCPFLVRFASSADGTGDYVCLTANLEHNHKSPRAGVDGSKRQQATTELRKKLLAAAEKELRTTKTVASYRFGFEDQEQQKGVVPPWLEQEVVMWTLKPEVGEEKARAFEGKMRKTATLVEGYPTKSTFDSPRPALALPPSPTPPPPSEPSTSPRKKVVKLKRDHDSAGLNGTAAALPKPSLEAVKEEEEDEDEWGCRRVRGRKRKPRKSVTKTSNAGKANLLGPSASTSTPLPYAGSSTPLVRYCKVKTPAIEPQASSSPRVDPGPQSAHLLSLPPSSASVASEPPGYNIPAPGACLSATRPRFASAPPSPGLEVPSLPFHAPADDTSRAFSWLYIAALLAALSHSSFPINPALVSSTLSAFTRAGITTPDDLANLVLLPKASVRLVVEEVKKRGGTRDEVEALAGLCKELRDEAGAKDVKRED
ncbi:hypothetical protein JCM8097_003765 [Rhodosporidiobolus ruineniae]